ncbi:aa3-type cytochrome c oxidase subunit IV [Paracoccus spongiarum]|uniref:Aa3-type cytochrome c oxidase subunit IV n=1 Tax=Paracoccus spongiarum TaxID=3064387 RepID=A0ABT9J7W9_9RHOB|nr:aa3-type cytochrome c oxidase subunit IV [Paracoccus sp. 2205BS29-5]MDP5305905.1 aa3-type cytochrome c oxidase subunit IV [Paracoccus sp. 2205BS29-5]
MADHQHVSDHKHGEMDITAHQKTFAGFIRMAIWVVVVSILVLIFMALTNA